MQTKNINLGRQNQEEVYVDSISDPSPSTPEISAPPLPPRLSVAQPTSVPQHGQIGPRPPPDPSAYSAYKLVPPPRPYNPPPYRMPPTPLPVYQKYGSEPSLPGTTANETAMQLHTYSAKFPPPPRMSGMSSKEWIGKSCEALVPPRIPNLSELPHVQRPRTANTAVAPEPGLPPPRTQVWVEEKQMTSKTVAMQQRWRSLMNQSPTPDQQQQHQTKPIDGEPLLPTSRRAVSYPDGISNPGLEDEGYVPSLPNQRVEGSRGQVLLETPPAKEPLPDINMHTSHPSLAVLSSCDSSDVRIPPPFEWANVPGEDGHSSSLRDTYLRLYPRNSYPQQHHQQQQQNQQQHHQPPPPWPGSSPRVRHDSVKGTHYPDELKRNSYVGCSSKQLEPLGEQYYYLRTTSVGSKLDQPDVTDLINQHQKGPSVESRNDNGDQRLVVCDDQLSSGRPEQSQQAVCAPYNQYREVDSNYYQKTGLMATPDANRRSIADSPSAKYPQKAMFNHKFKYNRDVLLDSMYNGNCTKPVGEGSSQSGHTSAGSSDYEKNLPYSGNTNTASESGRGTLPPSSSAKSSSLSGTMDSSLESSDNSPCQNLRKEVLEKEFHSPVKTQTNALVSQTRNADSATVSDSMSVTPPLPPLSPNHSPSDSPRNSPKLSKYKLSMSTPTLNKSLGDFVEGGGARGWSAPQIPNKRYGTPRAVNGAIPEPTWTGRQVPVSGNANGTTYRTNQQRPKSRMPIMLNPNLTHIHETGDGDLTSTTTGLDMESLLDDVSGSSGSLDGGSSPSSDVHELRRQLEGLEQMYSEVLKMLGIKPRNGLLGIQRPLQESKSKRKVHGSLSSLTGKSYLSSASKTRTFKDKRYSHDKRKGPNDGKGISRRFQRLESHVVTLARSVAHLSSEMRTQHVMFQEIENLRREVTQLSDQQMALRCNMNGGMGGKPARGAASEWDNFRSTIPSLTNPTRIKKLAKFFGDEPPLLRLFLKKLGYEKYASNFEAERIGMIELPYLTEERLQKIGIPMGPRMRILQEAQMSFRQEHFNIYIV